MTNNNSSGWLGQLRKAWRQDRPRGASGARKRRPRSRPAVERLEDRTVPALPATWVNDTWHLFLDADSSGGLSNGDIVTNANDSGTLTGYIYGTQAFGTVTSGPGITGPTSVPGSATIDDAINNTLAGGTVNVYEGTYHERADVNKTLTLRGAQAGVDARTRTAVPESIITGVGNNGQTPISVTASNVVIDGFTVEGATNVNQFGFGILLGAGTSGSQVLNNIIQDNIAGLSLANNSGTAQTVIQHNLFRNNDQTGSVSGSAIYSDQFNAGGALTNVLIDSNTFDSNNSGGGAAINLSSTSAGSQTNVTISNNSFTGNDRALFAENLVNSSFTGNTVSGSTFVGSADLRLGDGVSNVLFDNNTLTGTGADLRGVRVSDFGDPGGAPSGLTFSNNRISGYGNAGIEIDFGSASVSGNDFRGTLTGLNGAGDADDNVTDLRLASTAGPVTIGSNNQFAGNTYYVENHTPQSYDLSANGSTFDYTNNFRIADRIFDALDDPTSGLIRWVPVGDLYVSGPGTGASDETIQNAVNAATAGETIHVEAGTFHEEVTVNKTLTLLGAQAGVDARTGRVGAQESVIDGSTLGGAVVVTANNVVIDGFTIQGDSSFTSGFNTGIHAGGGSGLHAVNNIIQSVPIGISPSGSGNVIQFNLIRNTITGPAGQSGIYTDFGLSNTLIDSNKFVNNPNGAIILTGSAPGAVTTTTVSNNQTDSDIVLFFNTGTQVTGNTVTNSTGHGVELGGGDTNISISDNTISGVGSGFSGVRIADFIGGQPNSNVSIQNNVIATGPEFGIRVGLASYTGTLAANLNAITGTGTALSNEDAAVTVDASSNFWGSSSPTTVQGRIAGTGAANVDFTPLLNNDESVANQSVVGFQPDLSAVTVHALGTQTGLVGRIAEGIALVSTGGTVTAAAGTYAENVDVNRAITLAGTPTINGTLTASASGAVVSPGGAAPGTMNSGNLSLASGTTLSVQINSGGAGVGFDRLNVNGTVSLGGSQLQLAITFPSTSRAQFVIINNDGSDPVSGTFAGLPEGSIVTGAGRQWRLSYHGGTGNDVTLTQILPPPPTPQATQVTVTVSYPNGRPFLTVRNKSTGAVLWSAFPYGPSFTGLVRTAVGDTTGDGFQDVLVMPAQGGGALLKGFNGKTAKMLFSFPPFDASRTGPHYLNSYDFDHDGHSDIVAVTTIDGRLFRKIFSGRTLQLLDSRFVS